MQNSMNLDWEVNRLSWGRAAVATNTKLRHTGNDPGMAYKAEVRNTVLYAAKTITLGRHGAEQLKKEKILSRILGSKEIKNGNQDQG